MRRRRFGGDKSSEVKQEEEEKVVPNGGAKTNRWSELFEQMWGFRPEELGSLEGFACAMYRPTDPACLGVVRALFGACMLVDVVDERGFAVVEQKWGDPWTCHFPLVHGLRPMGLPWMVVVYAVMWLGALGMALGYRFRLACGLFVVPYWYLFLLDKSFMNNHSYLYGVVATIFWCSDANKYFSLDSKWSTDKGEKDASVPYWNYYILKYQFFVLYLIAGLKKSSREWLEGYSMANLSRHWVFEPFKLFLTTEQTDLYVVHWFGFLLDLSVGFLMLLDRTRAPAMLLCCAFHLMNSRLFSIGMFPYVCLGTMPLFCRCVDWPRKLPPGGRNCSLGGDSKPAEEDAAAAAVVGYFPRRDLPEDDERILGRRREPEKRKRRSVTGKQKFVAGLLIAHVALQLFLPYSHFVTKGYNNWVPGLYGYSWDMMVHAWETGLVVVRLRDNDSGKEYFVDPDTWTPNNRWARHGDMLWQYARCIKDNVEKLKEQRRPQFEELSSNLSVYADVWYSLNGRFQQRLFDPGVDLLRAEWHPLRPVSYLVPLLRQFSSYRSELVRIERWVHSWPGYSDVLFVADFPGMSLENYVDAELDNVTLSVLEGEVAYHADAGGAGTTMAKGDDVRVETGRLHRVVTTSPHPACYMYTFANSTMRLHHLRLQQQRGMKEEEGSGVKEAFPIVKELAGKARAFYRSAEHFLKALAHLAFGVPMRPPRRISN